MIKLVEYIKLNNFEDFKITGLEHIYTDDFTIMTWVKARDLNSFGTNVVKNRFGNYATISMTGTSPTTLNVYCSGLGYISERNENIAIWNTKADIELNLNTDKYSTITTLNNMNNIWAHMRCGVSFKQQKMSSLLRHQTTEHYQEKTIKLKLYQYSGTTYNLSNFVRPFKTDSSTTEVEFKGLQNISKSFLIKGYRIFRHLVNKEAKIEY